MYVFYIYEGQIRNLESFQSNPSPEAELLDEIQTKVLWVFLPTVHSHLYSFALIFHQAHATSYSFYSSVIVHYKEERRKTL
jgi:hypothetical protein